MSDSLTQPARIFTKRDLYISLGLLLACALTYLVGEFVASKHEATIDTRIAAEIVEAFDEVEDRFDSMQEELLGIAQKIGSSNRRPGPRARQAIRPLP